MIKLEMCRLRKATDINRKYALFELVTDDTVLLDVGFSDEEIFQVCFHEKIASLIIDWIKLQEWIKKGKEMAELDRTSG